jgi:hypothetical protein
VTGPDLPADSVRATCGWRNLAGTSVSVNCTYGAAAETGFLDTLVRAAPQESSQASKRDGSVCFEFTVVQERGTICEAPGVPVPTRMEVTNAANGHRHELVLIKAGVLVARFPFSFELVAPSGMVGQQTVVVDVADLDLPTELFSSTLQ